MTNEFLFKDQQPLSMVPVSPTPPSVLQQDLLQSGYWEHIRAGEDEIFIMSIFNIFLQFDSNSNCETFGKQTTKVRLLNPIKDKKSKSQLISKMVFAKFGPEIASFSSQLKLSTIAINLHIVLQFMQIKVSCLKVQQFPESTGAEETR